MMNKYGMVWVGGLVQEMIQEPLMYTEYKECRCSTVTSLLGSSQGISLCGRLGTGSSALFPVCQGSRFLGGQLWLWLCLQGSRLEQDQVLRLERCCTKLSQGKELVLGTPSFHIPGAP